MTPDQFVYLFAAGICAFFLIIYGLLRRYQRKSTQKHEEPR